MSTRKMENIWNNSKAILDVIDESDSDTESIFSGNCNSESEDSDNEDNGVSNNSDDDTDDNVATADGWSKYNIQPDFVKFNFTAQSGFKPPNPAPSDIKNFFVLFFTSLCFYLYW